MFTIFLWSSSLTSSFGRAKGSLEETLVSLSFPSASVSYDINKWHNFSLT